MLEGKSKTLASATSDFEQAIGWLKLEQCDAPDCFWRVLAHHAFADKLTDKSSWIAMLLIKIGRPSCA